MKFIAHRGNTNGPNFERENQLDYIEEAIADGFDAEIDIWYLPQAEKFYLGHDKPQYLVSWYWLAKHMEYLWIHCKNLDALDKFCNTGGYNFFWHDTDRFTLTSKKFIWTYPGQPYSPKSIIVMPESMKVFPTFQTELGDMKAFNCHGICSDYVGQMR